MGGVVGESNRLAVDVDVRGAEGDTLVLVGPDGPVAERVIDADTASLSLEVRGARGFVRAEVMAKASASRLTAALERWCDAHGLPSGIEHGVRARGRLVRALSNPIYIRPTCAEMRERR